MSSTIPSLGSNLASESGTNPASRVKGTLGRIAQLAILASLLTGQKVDAQNIQTPPKAKQGAADNQKNNTESNLTIQIKEIRRDITDLGEEMSKGKIDTSKFMILLDSLERNESILRVEAKGILTEFFKRFEKRFAEMGEKSSRKAEFGEVGTQIKKRLDAIGTENENLIETMGYIATISGKYPNETNGIDTSKMKSVATYVTDQVKKICEGIKGAPSRVFGFIPSEKMKGMPDRIGMLIVKGNPSSNVPVTGKSIAPDFFSGKKTNWAVANSGTDASIRNIDGVMEVTISSIEKGGSLRVSYNAEISKGALAKSKGVIFRAKIECTSPAIEDLMRIKFGHDGVEVTGAKKADTGYYEVFVPQKDFTNNRFQANLVVWRGSAIKLNEAAILKISHPEVLLVE